MATTYKLPSTLIAQVDSFVDTLEKYNSKRPRPRREKDYDFLRLFFKDFLLDRNTRATSVESDAYKNALAVAKKQFPVQTMFNLCLDGRVLAILSFGIPAALGPSLRIGGGMIRDFIRGEDGKLMLKEDSMYGQLLRRALDNYKLDTLAEIYDSHIGCAARLAEEQLKGRKPLDSGLFADVSHKRQIADATKRYFAQQFHDQKHIIPIQTSFDPHTGYLYMGLELDDVFAYVRRTRKGYTKEVLENLVHERKIISTQELAQKKEILNELEKNHFVLNWKNEYVTSTGKFWSAIQSMNKVLYPIFEKELVERYPHLKGRDELTKKERETRVLLLIANTFSGYLNNNLSRGESNKMKVGVSYPYGVHREQGIKISEGGYPPYDISMFVIFSLDTHNLPANVDLAAMLVRGNRIDKRVEDRYSLYQDSQEFAEASVPIVMQEIIRDELTPDQWGTLENMEWGDLPTNWESMSDMAFIEYLHKKGNVPVGVVMGINNLRKRMAVLFNPAYPTSSHLIEHYKVALPVVTGRYRRHHFVIPFVKLGFE